MLEIGTMIAAARSGLASALGLSPSARRRSRLNATLRLYRSFHELDGLEEPRKRLAVLLDHQVEDLCVREEKTMSRTYAWSTLIVGVIVDAAVGLLVYQLTVWGGIAGTVFAWILGVIGAFVLIAFVGAFFSKPKPDQAKDPSRHGIAQQNAAAAMAASERT